MSHVVCKPLRYQKVRTWSSDVVVVWISESMYEYVREYQIAALVLAVTRERDDCAASAEPRGATGTQGVCAWEPTTRCSDMRVLVTNLECVRQQFCFLPITTLSTYKCRVVNARIAENL